MCKDKEQIFNFMHPNKFYIGNKKKLCVCVCGEKLASRYHLRDLALHFNNIIPLCTNIA